MGNYVYNLIAALSQLPHSHEFTLYVDDPKAAQYVPQDPRFTLRVLPPKAYPVWEHVSFPLAAARDRVHVLHCPANTGPFLLPAQTRLVLTIHDVMYLLPKGTLPASPSNYQRLGALYRRLVVPAAARRAAAIVVVSKHSRSDVLRLLKPPSEKVAVVGEAPGNACRVLEDRIDVDAVRAKYGLNHPYLLCFGGIDPRKNTARVLEGYCLFRKRASCEHRLVLVGLPSSAERRYVREADDLGVARQVVFTGFVSEEELVALYNGAEALVYPSLYEGFGLPVLEAMACGTPVITSARGSLPEAAGDAAIMVDPLNVEDIAAAMLRIAQDEMLRRQLIARGFTQASKFSWRNTAEQMLAVYEKAASKL